MQSREHSAAASLRPDSATSFAATAVFSQRWMVTFLSVCKKSEHWSIACWCE